MAACMTRAQMRMVALLGIVFAVGGLPFSERSDTIAEDGEPCSGPPYLYVTLHHEKSNVLKYSRNGCLLSKRVLIDVPLEMEVNFRDMAISKKGDLYLANAAPKDGGVLVYGDCIPENYQNANGTRFVPGQRFFKGEVTGVRYNPGANHAYGIALDEDFNVYASFQHTDTILRFYADSYDPMPLPPALDKDADSTHFFLGTFHQFGKAEIHPSYRQGVRGIAVVNRTLWVANRNLAGVEVLDMDTGAVIGVVSVREPIGVTYSPAHGLVFVSSKGNADNDHSGAVKVVDAATRRLVSEMRTTHMRHPTGMAVHADVLYVAEQALGHVFAFHIPSGLSLGKAIRYLPGRVEQVEISHC